MWRGPDDLFAEAETKEGGGIIQSGCHALFLVCTSIRFFFYFITPTLIYRFCLYLSLYRFIINTLTVYAQSPVDGSWEMVCFEYDMSEQEKVTETGILSGTNDP